MTEREDIADLKQEIERLRKVVAQCTPDLESLLKQRGFIIYKKEPAEDLVLPEGGIVEDFYRRMKKYSFRLFLRDVIKFQDGFTIKRLARYATPQVTKEYTDFLSTHGVVEQIGEEFRLKGRPVRSFGTTLEWFLAEVFKREFLTEALWGVKFRRIKSGGDYDLIAKINGSILYMEAKSSPPKQVYDREIAAFFNRIEDLQPALAIFFMDTELRMKDKIVPFFEEELKKRQEAPPEVTRMEKELFHIADRIFIINAAGSIVANIEKALQWYFRNNS